MLLNFGYGRKPLHVQLGVKKEATVFYDELLKWLISANCYGMISDGEFDRAMKRLSKRLHKILEDCGKDEKCKGRN